MEQKHLSNKTLNFESTWKTIALVIFNKNRNRLKKPEHKAGWHSFLNHSKEKLNQTPVHWTLEITVPAMKYKFIWVEARDKSNQD